jgi:hypothetical protein
MRLGAAQSPKALVSRAAYQGFQAQTHGLRIRGSVASRLRLSEELVVDVEGLLHLYNYSILVWLLKPYLAALLPIAAKIPQGDPALSSLS